MSHDVVSYTVALPGLFGPLAVLPSTDQVNICVDDVETRQGNFAFFDIFHQQIYLTAYHSWLSRRLWLSYYESNNNLLPTSADQSAIQNLLVGLSGQLHRESALDYSLLSHCLLLQKKYVSLSSLHALLRDYLQCDLSIHSLQPVRQLIKVKDRMLLSSHCKKNPLGVTSGLGASIISYQSDLVLELGPLSYQQYLALLPGAQQSKQLQSTLYRLVPSHLTVYCQLVLARNENTCFKLGDTAMVLGRVSWLGRASVLKNRHGCCYGIV